MNRIGGIAPTIVLLLVALILLPPASTSLCYAGPPVQDPPETAEQWTTWEFTTTEQPGRTGIYHIDFSDDGRLIATRDLRNMVSVFDLQKQEKLCEFESHEPLVSCIRFSPDGKSILACARGSFPVRVYSTVDGQLKGEFGNDISDVSFSKDGKFVYGLGSDRVMKLSWPELREINDTKWQTERRQMRVCMSDDGSLVVSGTNQGAGRPVQITLHNLVDRSTVNLGSHDRILKKGAISPNRNWFAAVFHRDDEFMLIDLRDPHNTRKMVSRHKGTVQSVGFSEDSRYLFTTSWDSSVVVWDTVTGGEIAELNEHVEHVNASASSVTGMLIASGASGTKDNRVIVRDLTRILFPEEELPDSYSDFDFVWKSLGSEDPHIALKAVQALLAKPDTGVAQLRTMLVDELVESSRDEILKLITELDSPVFARREEATRNLMDRRVSASELLRARLESECPLEVRMRINAILRLPSGRPDIAPDLLRSLHRSIFALERIGNEEACQLLEDIARGHRDTDVSGDAMESLKRIQK